MNEEKKQLVINPVDKEYKAGIVELRWIRVLLTVIAIPILVLILRTLKSIFIPLVFALFLSFVFAPLNQFLRKKGLPVWMVMIVNLLVIALLMAASILILSEAASSLVNGFPSYQKDLFLRMETWMQYFEELAQKMNLAMSDYTQMDVSQLIAPGSFSISKTLTNVMATTMDIVWNFFLIMIFLMFIVGADNKLVERLKKVLSPKEQKRTVHTILNIQTQIQRYLLTKTVISLATAIVGMVLMLLYGVDFVLVCGIILFVLNFIPNIGSIIASAIPIIICFLQSGFDLRTIFFSLLIIATQMLFGNVLEPKIHGERLNLSPITVLVSLIFWGWVWGIMGMILAVPITSALNIILIQIDEKNVVSAVISG